MASVGSARVGEFGAGPCADDEFPRFLRRQQESRRGQDREPLSSCQWPLAQQVADGWHVKEDHEGGELCTDGQEQQAVREGPDVEERTTGSDPSAATRTLTGSMS
jgi:hypothetical protein